MGMKRATLALLLASCGGSDDDDGGGVTVPIETPPQCDAPNPPIAIPNGTYPIARWYCMGKQDLGGEPLPCPADSNQLGDATSFAVTIATDHTATVTFQPAGRILTGFTTDGFNDSVINLDPDTVEGVVFRCTTSTIAGSLTMSPGQVSWELR